MIDQRLRQQVRAEVEAITPSQGNLETVLYRGRRRRRNRHVVQTVGVAAAIGLIGVSGLVGFRSLRTDSSPATSEVPDLALVMQPGDGPGALARDLAELAGPPVVEGSATHVAWVAVADGRFDIVSFRSLGVAPRYPDLEVACRGVVNEATGFSLANCDSGPDQTKTPPGYQMDGESYAIFTETPTGAGRALITTTNGQTIEVHAAAGFVFARWNLPWGPPELLEFVNANNDVIERADYELPATAATTASTTTTTTSITTHTMVPSMDSPAMARFAALVGFDERSSPDGVLYAFVPSPTPLDPPVGMNEQLLRAPTLDDASEKGFPIAYQLLGDRPRWTPLLLAGINEQSDAFTVVWVEPASDNQPEPVFCVAVIVGDGASLSCGSPELADTTSRYTLPMTSVVEYAENRESYMRPIHIGSGTLPLETAYTILEGPQGDQWMQRPVSGTVLYSIDTPDVIGRYQLSGYDTQGNEIAVGSYVIPTPNIPAPDV